jgi:hypothetical protein
MADVFDAIEHDLARHVEATAVILEGGDVGLDVLVAHGRHH